MTPPCRPTKNIRAERISPSAVVSPQRAARTYTLFTLRGDLIPFSFAFWPVANPFSPQRTEIPPFVALLPP